MAHSQIFPDTVFQPFFFVQIHLLSLLPSDKNSIFPVKICANSPNLLSKVLLQASFATDSDHKFRQRAVEHVKSKLTSNKPDNSCSPVRNTTKNS